MAWVIIRTHKYFTAAVAGLFWRNFRVRIIALSRSVAMSRLRVDQHAMPEGTNEGRAYFDNEPYIVIVPLKQSNKWLKNSCAQQKLSLSPQMPENYGKDTGRGWERF